MNFLHQDERWQLHNRSLLSFEGVRLEFQEREREEVEYCAYIPQETPHPGFVSSVTEILEAAESPEHAGGWV